MIAIKRNNGELIWMDAILSFQESYSTSVTKHQIESGSTISDHITQNNATFNLSGVVVGAEFNNSKGLLAESGISFAKEDGTNETITNVNGSSPIGFVQINSSFLNPLVKLLPESVRQFISKDSPANVEMGLSIGTPDSIESIKELLISLNRGKREENKLAPTGFSFVKEVVSLIEFDSNYKILNVHDDCVCTSINFSQDTESGEAIYPQMTFEQVRFVSLLSTKLPTNVSSAIKNKSSGKDQKGAEGEGASTQQNTSQQRTRNTGQDASFLYETTIKDVRTR